MNKKTRQLVQSISGWLTTHEGQFLEKAALLTAEVTGEVVEIGSFCGKSTIWLAISGRTVYAIDPHKGKVSGGKTKSTYKEFLENLRKAGIADLVRPLVATSKQAATTWKRPISLLFIDGLHDEAHASEDFRLWSKHVESGGIIAMHDSFCGWEGAGKVAMSKIIHARGYREVGVVGSILYGIKGNAEFTERLNLYRCRLLINLSQNLHWSHVLPPAFTYIIIHKLLRVLLVNRFTLKRTYG